jgi:hypothetical protein
VITNRETRFAASPVPPRFAKFLVSPTRFAWVEKPVAVA